MQDVHVAEDITQHIFLKTFDKLDPELEPIEQRDYLYHRVCWYLNEGHYYNAATCGTYHHKNKLSDELTITENTMASFNGSVEEPGYERSEMMQTCIKIADNLTGKTKKIFEVAVEVALNSSGDFSETIKTVLEEKYNIGKWEYYNEMRKLKTLKGKFA